MSLALEANHCFPRFNFNFVSSIASSSFLYFPTCFFFDYLFFFPMDSLGSGHIWTECFMFCKLLHSLYQYVCPVWPLVAYGQFPIDVDTFGLFMIQTMKDFTIDTEYTFFMTSF